MKTLSESHDIEFILKTRVAAGEGMILQLPVLLRDLSLFRIGLIIDEGVVSNEYIRKIIHILENDPDVTLIRWVYDLKAEPDYDTLDERKADFLDGNGKSSVDCYIGIGGGSVIDFAKGLATLATNPGKALSYRGFPKDLKPSLPVIAVPTTSGSGSEVTYNAVFINWHDKKKLGINTTNNFPVLAILDPRLVASAPRSVTLSSGMDAMVHTMESYVATKANAITRIFSREAFALLFNNLERVITDPDNLDARANVQLGAYYAGIAIMNSGSGPAGALSYPLGVHFRVPHGFAGGIFLPHIIRHNILNGYDYSELYDLIAGTDPALPATTKNQIFSEKIFELWHSVGMPPNLRLFGVTPENISILLDETINLKTAFAQNPIPFSAKDAKLLLEKMVHEDR